MDRLKIFSTLSMINLTHLDRGKLVSFDRSTVSNV